MKKSNLNISVQRAADIMPRAQRVRIGRKAVYRTR